MITVDGDMQFLQQMIWLFWTILYFVMVKYKIVQNNPIIHIGNWSDFYEPEFFSDYYPQITVFDQMTKIDHIIKCLKNYIFNHSQEQTWYNKILTKTKNHHTIQRYFPKHFDIDNNINQQSTFIFSMDEFKILTW